MPGPAVGGALLEVCEPVSLVLLGLLVVLAVLVLLVPAAVLAGLVLVYLRHPRT